MRGSYPRIDEFALGARRQMFATALVLLAALPQPALPQSDDPSLGNSALPPRVSAEDIDPEARKRRVEDRAEAMKSRIEEDMQETFGASVEELSEMGSLEILLRLGANGMKYAARPAAAPHVSPPEPAWTSSDYVPAPAPIDGFADGASPLRIPSDGDAVVIFDDPDRGSVLLVVADPNQQRILFNEVRSVPVRESLNLHALAGGRLDLVVEIVDRRTHRVLKRLRPAADDTEAQRIP